jgi:hypothetical protein
VLPRWAGAPRPVRAVVAAEVVVLGYGTVVHVVQLAVGGLDASPGTPGWLAGYLVSLTVFDPVAAVLLWQRRAAGLWLAVAVLVTDAAANGYAVYGLGLGGAAARVGQAVVTLLALGAVAAAPWLRRRRDRAGPRPPRQP